MRLILLPSALLYTAACAAPVVDNDTALTDPDPVAVALPIPDELRACFTPESIEGEDIGGACEAFTASDVCGAVCFTLHVTGCTAVGLACIDGSVVTLGALAVPCSFAVTAACGAAVASPLSCGEACRAIFPLSLQDGLQ